MKLGNGTVGLAPNGYMPPPGLVTMRLLELMSTLTRLSLDKNGRHFANDIFKWIFMSEEFCVFIQFLLTFVPKGPMTNESVLVRVMAWCHYPNQRRPSSLTCGTVR